jgi:hypothetical protein
MYYCTSSHKKTRETKGTTIKGEIDRSGFPQMEIYEQTENVEIFSLNMELMCR